jgi:hypothetical protein
VGSLLNRSPDTLRVGRAVIKPEIRAVSPLTFVLSGTEITAETEYNTRTGETESGNDAESSLRRLCGENNIKRSQGSML